MRPPAAPVYDAGALEALPSLAAVLTRPDKFLPAPGRPWIERAQNLLVSYLRSDPDVRDHDVIVEAPHRLQVTVDGAGLEVQALRTGRADLEVIFTELGHRSYALNATAALARLVVVESWSGGIAYRQSFSSWRPDAPARIVGPTGRRGYRVVYLLGDPDDLLRRARAGEMGVRRPV